MAWAIHKFAIPCLGLKHYFLFRTTALYTFAFNASVAKHPGNCFFAMKSRRIIFYITHKMVLFSFTRIGDIVGIFMKKVEKWHCILLQTYTGAYLSFPVRQIYVSLSSIFHPNLSSLWIWCHTFLMSVISYLFSPTFPSYNGKPLQAFGLTHHQYYVRFWTINHTPNLAGWDLKLLLY